MASEASFIKAKDCETKDHYARKSLLSSIERKILLSNQKLRKSPDDSCIVVHKKLPPFSNHSLHGQYRGMLETLGFDLERSNKRLSLRNPHARSQVKIVIKLFWI